MINLRVEVSLALNTAENFTYEVRNDAVPLGPGTRVVVPVWNRIVPGWVVNTSSAYTGKVKPVLGVVDSGYHPGTEFMTFVKEVARSFLISPGKLLDLSLSPAMRSQSGIMCRSTGKDFPLFKRSAAEILQLGKESTLRLYYKNRDALDEPPSTLPPAEFVGTRTGNYTVYLSHRRKDYYREIWERDRARGKSTYILLPNNLAMGRYESELPDLRVYNSSLKSSLREEIWSASRRDKPIFIGGGESGLFLPFSHPGTVIVEKPGSFFYSRNLSSGIDLREAARIKARVFGVDLLEGSSGLLPVHIFLNESLRITDERPEPSNPVKIKKLEPGVKTPPEPVVHSIIDNFSKNQSVLVVVSKKGSGKFLFCPECKSVFRCPSCGNSAPVKPGSGASCVSCSFSSETIPECSKCGKSLKVIEDLSVASLKTRLVRGAGEENVISYEPDPRSGEMDPLIQRDAKKIVILTPVEAGCIPEDSFDHVVMVKPESFFDLNTYNGGELIWSFVNGLREILRPEGNIEVYTVFHFHYCMKKMNDEDQYLERELKYREMFQLPPYKEVFDLIFSDRNIRKLAEKMRKFRTEFDSKFLFSKSYLISREKKRGFFRGNSRVHMKPGELYSTGISRFRGIKIKKVIS